MVLDLELVNGDRLEFPALCVNGFFGTKPPLAPFSFFYISVTAPDGSKRLFQVSENCFRRIKAEADR